MAKSFNVSQREKRAAVANRKRLLHGDPITGKLKIKQQTHSVSGKRQRKLLKKWRREQKDAVEKGLLTMADVEMAAAEQGSPSQEASIAPRKFHLKKSVKIKASKKKKGKYALQ
ncbi:hypothetical protein V2J09_013280 [Rumex salicifolius]